MSFVGFRVGEAVGFPPAKMKRKELEDVANEFSEFSLSSPARKIRRLDLGLPPIFEEEESRSPFTMDQFQSDIKQLSSLPEADISSSSSNEERTLVLYRPLYSPLPEPDVPDVSFKVDPEWMSNFKSTTLQSGYSNQMVSSTGQSSFRADNTEEPSVCMDVVPWTPSHLSEVTNSVQRASSKLLDEEEMDTEEGTTMEVEELQTTIESGPSAMGRKEASHLQQCQQHHCMNPPTDPSPSTPVMWSW